MAWRRRTQGIHAVAVAVANVPVVSTKNVVERRSQRITRHRWTSVVAAAVARHHGTTGNSCLKNRVIIGHSCKNSDDLLFISGEQKGERDCPISQLGMLGSVTLPGDMTFILLEL